MKINYAANHQPRHKIVNIHQFQPRSRGQWCDPRLGTTLRGTQVCLAQMNCLLSWEFLARTAKIKTFSSFSTFIRTPISQRKTLRVVQVWLLFDSRKPKRDYFDNCFFSLWLLSPLQRSFFVESWGKELFIFYQSIFSQFRVAPLFSASHFKCSRI